MAKSVINENVKVSAAMAKRHRAGVSVISASNRMAKSAAKVAIGGGWL